VPQVLQRALNPWTSVTPANGHGLLPFSYAQSVNPLSMKPCVPAVIRPDLTGSISD
jgi:hypothetical protein